MAVSKVIYNNNGVQETLIDVSQDTVTQSDVAQGVTFHDAQGIQQVGTATGGASLGTKSINANGTYQASRDGLDGFSEVSVNVTTPDALSKSLIEGTLTSIGPSELSNVDSIGPAAFAFKMSLQSVQIPDTITVLQGYTFSMCPNLTSITLPSTLTTLGEAEFSGSSSLSTLTYNGSTESSPCLPPSLTSIGANCFSEFPMSGAITIPGGVTELFGSTFYGSQFTTIILGEGLTTLGESEFSESALQYLTVPSTFTGFSSRDGYALSNCNNISQVNFNQSLVNMVNTGWLLRPNYNTSILAHNIVCTDYTLPYGGQNNVTVAGSNQSTMNNGGSFSLNNAYGAVSFSNTLTVLQSISTGSNSTDVSVISISFPNTLKVIQRIDNSDSMYSGGPTWTYNLTSFTVPDSVVYLGDPDYALFSNGSGTNANATITTLILESTTPPYLGTGSLGTLNALTSIVVPQGTLSTYQNDAQWSQYSSMMSEA